MNIIVTGASQGIGREVVKLLAQNKSNRIIAIARNANALNDLADTAQNQNIIPLIYSIEEVIVKPQALFEAIVTHFEHVDVLINNAGLLINNTFEQLSTTDAMEMFRINYFAPSALIKTLLPLMGKEEARSHVVNISSIGGFQGSSKFTGLSHYSASKAALSSLTECLAEEFKKQNIVFNALALGAVQTEMLEQAFPGYKAPVTPDKMAEFIAWFAIQGPYFFNGKTIPVSVSVP